MGQPWHVRLRARPWAARSLRLGRLALGLWREMAVAGAVYPIFHRELNYWQQGPAGRWRLEELFALLALANLCLMPVTLLMFPKLLLAQALLDELLGLGIAIPAATLVVRERDQHTWAVLRATTLTTRQILLGKGSGLLNLVWQGAHLLARARLLGAGLALPLLALLFVLPGQFPLAGGRGLSVIALGLVLAYLAFIYRPLLNLLHGACLGLLASTLAGSTRRAVALAVGGQMLWAAVSVALLVVFARSPDLLGAWFGDSVLAAHLRQIYVWVLPLGLVTALRLLATPAWFALAVYRVNRRLD